MDRALAYRNNPLSSLGKGVCGTGDEALRRDRRARQRHRVRSHGLAPTAGSAEAGGRSASLRAARAPGVHSQDAAFGAVGSWWALGCTDGPWGRGHTNGGVGAQSPPAPRDTSWGRPGASRTEAGGQRGAGAALPPQQRKRQLGREGRAAPRFGGPIACVAKASAAGNGIPNPRNAGTMTPEQGPRVMSPCPSV